MRLLGQDLRDGARMLLKNPGYTLIAVIMLALTAKSDARWISAAFAQEQSAISYQDLLVWAETKEEGHNQSTNCGLTVGNRKREKRKVSFRQNGYCWRIPNPAIATTSDRSTQ